MKFFAFIFAAFLCISIAYSAPSTHNPSFNEFNNSNLINDLNIVKDAWNHLKCVQNVVDDIMNESDVKTIWISTKEQLKKIIETEWPECSQIPDKIDQEECRIDCIRKTTVVINYFFTQLFNGNHFDLANKIRSEVTSRCFAENEISESSFSEEPFAGPSITEGFQCLVDTLQQVSQDLNLDALWESNAEEIQSHLDNWKECVNLDNRLAIMFCKVKESVLTYKLIVEYVREAVAENPEFARYFLTEYRRKCAVSFQIINIETSIEHLKCMIDATSAAVKETDFGTIWDGYQSDLKKILQRIKLCQTQINKWEAAKCVGKEMYGTYDVFKYFMNELKQANQETYSRVKKYINERCYQGSQIEI